MKPKDSSMFIVIIPGTKNYLVYFSLILFTQRPRDGGILDSRNKI